MPLSAGQAAGTIDTLDIKVVADGGVSPLIQQRMQSSVRAISEELFVGSPIARVVAQQTEYESIIHQECLIKFLWDIVWKR